MLGSGRNDDECRARWKRLTMPDSKSRQWTPEEEALLASLVRIHGSSKWTEIAKLMNEQMGAGIDGFEGRTGKQCRERWHNHCDPRIRKGGWKATEDEIILRKQRALGNRWAAIAKELVGRTENQVKNRFNSLIRRSRGAAKTTTTITAAGSRPLGAQPNPVNPSAPVQPTPGSLTLPIPPAALRLPFASPFPLRVGMIFPGPPLRPGQRHLLPAPSPAQSKTKTLTPIRPKGALPLPHAAAGMYVPMPMGVFIPAAAVHPPPLIAPTPVAPAGPPPPAAAAAAAKANQATGDAAGVNVGVGVSSYATTVAPSSNAPTSPPCTPTSTPELAPAAPAPSAVGGGEREKTVQI